MSHLHHSRFGARERARAATPISLRRCAAPNHTAGRPSRACGGHAGATNGRPARSAPDKISALASLARLADPRALAGRSFARSLGLATASVQGAAAATSVPPQLPKIPREMRGD